MNKVMHTLLYDEFGKKDYEGIILLFVFMSPALAFLSVLIWLRFKYM